MAADNRDWYRDWWRKKTGYVERAGFRMSEAGRQRQAYVRAWRSIFLKAVLVLAFLLAAIVVKRYIR